MKFFLSDDYLTIYSKSNFQPPQGDVVARIRKSANSLYRFNPDSASVLETRAFAQPNKQPISISTWHKRLAHTNIDDIRRLSTSGAFGSGTTNELPKRCEACILGKISRKPFKSSDHMKTSCPGEIIHSDIMGPFSTPGLKGHRYFVTYIDHFSRFATVALLKNKSKQLENMKGFIAAFNNQHNVTIKQVQTDNGGEYISRATKTFLESRGIHHRLTAPGDSESNGIAERINRTLTDMALSMLAQARLPKSFFLGQLWRQLTFIIVARTLHSRVA